MKYLLLVFVLLFTLFRACKSIDDSLGDTVSVELKVAVPFETIFPIQLGNKQLDIQLALQSSEMSRGLMFRESLAEDQGMIFLYEKPRSLSFWMRNVSFPLDIAFFDDKGTLLEIRHMFPFDETSVKSNSTSVKFALEVNRSWFSKHAIKPGFVIDLEPIKNAVSARGFDPEIYFSSEAQD